MYKIIAAFIFLFPACRLLAQSGAGDELTLWYARPAAAWEEALPLGNGKTGAMVFGGIQQERYQLNDNTLWSGYPDAGNNPQGPLVLPEVRKAVFAGEYDKAAALWKKMQGPYSARYLPMGNLLLDFHGRDTVPTQYRRSLNLRTATARVEYTAGGTTYRRETWISYPDHVMVVRLTASKKQALHLAVALNSLLRYQAHAVSNDYLVLQGKAPKYVANRDYEKQQVVYDEDPQGEGMRFEIHVRVKTSDGTVRAAGDRLEISNASSVTLYLSDATSFNGFNRSPAHEGKDAGAEAKQYLQQAFAKDASTLQAAHIRDYQSLFNRVHLQLGKPGAAAEALPTDERLKQFAAHPDDLGLQVLYYQFGRYLLIASSRPGSRPANLQGIWNHQVQPPWGSNYTTNINTEMNYWLAENTHLSECHQPLFDFMKELAVNGAQTAKVNYGIHEGWCVHHNTDLWAKTSPPGGYDWDPKGAPRWSCWPMAGAWLCTHLWEHYRFTGDQQFLARTAYPLMKGAAQFMLHWLVTDPVSGYLVTNPSTSPENTIKLNGKEYEVSMATTMDMSIIRELFTACVRASKTLGTDQAFCAALEQALPRLYPYHIGRYGQVQEWFKDWDDPNDKHRHISHLFGLYPGSQITPQFTPALAAAAKQSLLFRGDVSTGWSMAWKVNWWARLRDGNHAYKILSAALTYIDPALNKAQMSGGGTYPNLFDAHPPFQIDGNFGATAGITEMLLQSHEGELNLLPALPDAWQEGRVQGIRARGNYTVGIQWAGNKLTKATIYAGTGGICRIRTTIPVTVTGAAQAQQGESNPLLAPYGGTPFEQDKQASLTALDTVQTYVTELNAEKGKTYTIIPR
jgi:alpha-L-fucosidase 2